MTRQDADQRWESGCGVCGACFAKKSPCEARRTPERQYFMGVAKECIAADVHGHLLQTWG